MRGAGDDRRRVRRTVASATSNVPFAAILAGRQRLAIGEIGWRRLATATVLFCAAMLGHRGIAGIPAIPLTFM